MMTPGTVMEDCLRINTARQVAVSISSYSWLAAWLSKTAETIHLPYCGLFSELRRPDIRLADLTDTRYHFHVLPNLNWKRTPDVMKRNLKTNCRSAALSHNVNLWELEPPKLTAAERLQVDLRRLKKHLPW